MKSCVTVLVGLFVVATACRAWLFEPGRESTPTTAIVGLGMFLIGLYGMALVARSAYKRGLELERREAEVRLTGKGRRAVRNAGLQVSGARCQVAGGGRRVSGFRRHRAPVIVAAGRWFADAHVRGCDDDRVRDALRGEWQ